MLLSGSPLHRCDECGTQNDDKKYLFINLNCFIVRGDSVATGGYSGMQAVVMGVVVLTIGGTLGLSLLGLSGGAIGVAFIIIFSSLMILAWPLFKKTHPRYDSGARE
jgi:hypothetical protein